MEVISRSLIPSDHKFSLLFYLIWTHSKKGAMVGAILGGMLKSLDTLFLFIMSGNIPLMVGTIVGRLRLKRIKISPLATPEGKSVWVKGIIVPAAAWAVVLPLYFWLNARLIDWLAAK